MSRFARALALLLVAAAIVLAVLAFSLSRPKPAPETARIVTTPVAPPPSQAVQAPPAEPVAPKIAAQLRPGERAVAIPVDEVTGVGNRIAPGDYVDVFFELKKNPNQGPDHADGTQARLLLSRTHVLTYGNSVLGVARPAGQGSGQTGGDGNPSTARTEQASPRTAVLAVPVDAVGGLLLAAREGKLLLALRHPDDERAPDTALFTTPPAVLPTRQGLTQEQQASVARPENQAYAGIDIDGLAGRNASMSWRPVRTQHAGPVSRNDGGIEIIRGAQRSRLFATSPCTGGKGCAP